MERSTLRSLSGAMALAIWTACGASSQDAPALGNGRDDTSERGCEYYPVSVADAGADESIAAASLETLSPGATIGWNAESSTLTGIANAAISLPECRGTDAVQDHLMLLLADHPEIFDIDPVEWRRTGDLLPCSYVTEVTRLVGFGRVLFGEHVTQASGTIEFAVRKENDEVVVFRVSADYTAATTAPIAAALTACEGEVATPSLILKKAEPESFRYLFVEGNAVCNLTGEGAYRPNQLDTVELESDLWWTRLSSAPALSLVRRGRLLVDPSNVTSEMLRSNANCGDAVGFALLVDAVTGEIVSYAPGATCTVC